jgi:hypothetical protein
MIRTSNLKFQNFQYSIEILNFNFRMNMNAYNSNVFFPLHRCCFDIDFPDISQFSHNKPEFQIINEALYPPFFMYYGRGKAKQQSVHIMYHLPLIFSNIFLCSINWLNCQAFNRNWWLLWRMRSLEICFHSFHLCFAKNRFSHDTHSFQNNIHVNG